MMTLTWLIPLFFTWNIRKQSEVAAKSQAEQFPLQLCAACEADLHHVFARMGLRGPDFHHFPQAKGVLHRQSTKKLRAIANAYCETWLRRLIVLTLKCAMFA